MEKTRRKEGEGSRSIFLDYGKTVSTVISGCKEGKREPGRVTQLFTKKGGRLRQEEGNIGALGLVKKEKGLQRRSTGKLSHGRGGGKEFQ